MILEMKRNINQNAARASWILPLLCIGIMAIGNFVLSNNLSSISWMILGIVYFLILISGIISGIVGCFGFQKHGAKSSLTQAIVGLLLNISIITIILLIAVPSFTKYQEDNKSNNLKAIQNLAAQTNAQLPQLIDEQTRLDKVIAEDSTTLKYLFTFITESKDSIDIETFSKEMKIYFNNEYKTNEQFKFFRDNNIKLIYEYHDQYDNYVTSVHID